MGDTPELLTAFLAGLRIGAVPVPVSTMLKPKDIAADRAGQPRPALVVSEEFADAGAGRRRAARPRRRRRRDRGSAAGASPAPGCANWAAFVAAGADFARAGGGAVPDDRRLPRVLALHLRHHRHAQGRDAPARLAARTCARRTRPTCSASARTTSRFSVAKFFFAYGLGNTLTFPFSVGAAHRPRPLAAEPRPDAARSLAGAPADAVLRRSRPSTPRCWRPALPGRRVRRRAGVRLGRRGRSPRLCCSALHRRASAWRCSTASGPPRRCTSSVATGPARSGPARPARSCAGYEAADRRTTTALPVPDGTPGHLYVRGELGRARATGTAPRSPARCSRGEWLRTGDTYVRTADGYYTCLGRNNDMLKAGGIWVSPTEVESRLRRAPRRSTQVVVVGVADADGLDKPVACVVLSPGAVDDGRGPRRLLPGRAGARSSAPRHVLVFDELPKTATGQAAALPHPRTRPRRPSDATSGGAA